MLVSILESRLTTLNTAAKTDAEKSHRAPDVPKTQLRERLPATELASLMHNLNVSKQLQTGQVGKKQNVATAKKAKKATEKQAAGKKATGKKPANK